MIEKDLKSVDYNSLDTYLISQSQVTKVRTCMRQWLYNYRIRLLGEEIDFYPFKYGNFIHELLEQIMQKNIENRVPALYNFLNTTDQNVPSNFLNKLYKIIDNIEKLSHKYKNITANPCELPIAISAPFDWFDEKLETILSKVYIKRGDVRYFDSFGFRGKIDYYGEDTETGEKCLIDFKTGGKRIDSKQQTKYKHQVFGYEVLGVVNGLKVDSLRLEFIEGDKEHNRVLTFDPNYDYGKKVVKKLLVDVANALVLTPKTHAFPKTDDFSNCNACQYAPFCLAEEPQFVSNHFFKALNVI